MAAYTRTSTSLSNFFPDSTAAGMRRAHRAHGAGIFAPRKACSRAFVSTQAHSRRAALAYIAVSPLLSETALPPAKAAFVDEDSAVAVFEKVAPSVVTVEDFTLVQGRETSEGVGSGFVWTKLGHVVTNYHCISKVIRDQTGKSVCQRCIECQSCRILLAFHYFNCILLHSTGADQSMHMF